MDSEWSGRDAADDATGALRDAPPALAPIDPNAPVSGHVVPPTVSHAPAPTAEDDWGVAHERVYPLLRPAGTNGPGVNDPPDPMRVGLHARAQPLVEPGPADLVVSYALGATGFDVLVNGDHLVSWRVSGTDLARAAMANLARWSSGAPFTDEVSGERRLLSSSTGDGNDAVRVLLGDVRAYLRNELAEGGARRVLIGLPERHMLLAGALRPDDADFVELFASFVAEQWEGADEALDRRVFELRGDDLVPFAP